MASVLMSVWWVFISNRLQEHLATTGDLQGWDRWCERVLLVLLLDAQGIRDGFLRMPDVAWPPVPVGPDGLHRNLSELGHLTSAVIKS